MMYVCPVNRVAMATNLCRVCARITRRKQKANCTGLWPFCSMFQKSATASADLMNVRAPLTHCCLLWPQGSPRRRGHYINLPWVRQLLPFPFMWSGGCCAGPCVALQSSNRSSFIAAPMLRTKKKKKCSRISGNLWYSTVDGIVKC